MPHNWQKSLFLFCGFRINSGMSYLYNRIQQLHDRFFHLVNHMQSPLLLFVRMYWGWQLAQSGWGKLHNLPNVTDFFMSLNLPYPAQTAIFISCVEFFGGILLALGLLSRMTALVLTINMVVAYVTADFAKRYCRFSPTPTSSTPQRLIHSSLHL